MDDTYLMFDNQNFSSSIFGTSIIDYKVIKTLTRLYELADWRCVLQDGQIEREYNNMSIISFFKALALPYLLNIPGERTLKKVITSEPTLQTLCGFYPGFLPKERTFWHFRNKYKHIYSNLLLRVLISLVLSGIEQDYDLPFVKNIEDTGKTPNNDLIEITLDHYRPEVFVQQRRRVNFLYAGEEYQSWQKEWKERFRVCDNFKEYEMLFEQYENELQKYRRKHAAGFLQELNFPIDVITLFHGKRIAFQLVTPSWFEEAQKLTFSVTASAKTYSKACNVIVIRKNNQRQEILLSQRKEKGYGQGEYAIPGGKQIEGESLEECAKRELREETNLEIIKSRPVSLFNNPNPYDPSQVILTVGVLVEDWEGELSTSEINRHVQWRWYDIENLPIPLFEPSKIALDQFLNNIYPNLTWRDVEKKRETQLSLL